MTHSALVIVDVQNDFAHPAGWVGRRSGLPPATQAAVARINTLIDAARKSSVPLFYVRVEHGPQIDAPSYRARYAARGFDAGGLLCAAGTWGAQLYDLLRAPRDGELVLIKHGYDAFVGTGLEEKLAAAGADTVVVCGLVTNVCVQATAEHAFELGRHVIVCADATASATDALQRHWLEHLAAFYGRVLDTAAIVDLWRTAR